MSKFSAKLTQAGFSFNLVADNNEIIATSQVYTSKGACLKGIESRRDHRRLPGLQGKGLLPQGHRVRALQRPLG